MIRVKALALLAVVALTIACGGGAASREDLGCGTNCRPNFTPVHAQATEAPAVSPTTPEGSPWSTKAPLLAPNSEIAVAQLDGKIYVIGGYPVSRFVVNTVQVYDIARDTWLRAAAGAGPPRDGYGRERQALRDRR